MKSLFINNREIKLVRSQRKTLGLQVSPQGITARAPKRMSERAIIDFIVSKEGWLTKILGNMPEPSQAKPIALQHGAKITYLGEPYTLEVIEGSTKPISIQGQTLIVPVANTHTALTQRIKTKLTKWFKQQAQLVCTQRAKHFAPWMQVKQRKDNQIYVRDYKRRWGSCDSKGKLSFNWRIIQAPSEVLDYVVIHELAHLQEFNHSKKFWSIVSQQMPDYNEKEMWLKKHGPSLYGF
ncbi:MAG: M48 family metallopeptidase [Gammaproteobacteria bacterium]|nr:M48 family metallopeptidase [Gammaproteobacteria bacterium]